MYLKCKSKLDNYHIDPHGIAFNRLEKDGNLFPWLKKESATPFFVSSQSFIIKKRLKTMHV